jgi:hypothetical protein
MSRLKPRPTVNIYEIASNKISISGSTTRVENRGPTYIFTAVGLCGAANSRTAGPSAADPKVGPL